MKTFIKTKHAIALLLIVTAGIPAVLLADSFTPAEKREINVDTPGLFEKSKSFSVDFTTLKESEYSFPLAGGKASASTRGLKISAAKGDKVKAMFGGTVRLARTLPSHGNVIVIRHNNGLETVYGHMSKQLVNEGDIVKKGDPIGLGGNTGRSTGSHLHFEILFMGVTINPALMFDFEQQDIVSDYFTFYKDGITNKDMYFSSVVEPKEQKDETLIVDKKVSQVKYHKVKHGETLSSIANKVGTTIDKLCSLNRITKRQTLRPGQILRYEE